MTETQGTPVADALAGVNAVQGEPGKFGLGPARELAALRDLADAVRSHGIVAELGQLREQRNTAPPVPGVTRPLPPYTVRAVLPRYDADGHQLGWWLAADNACGEWITWRAWEAGDGQLMCDQARAFTGRDVAELRMAALAHLARLAAAPCPRPRDHKLHTVDLNERCPWCGGAEPQPVAAS
jgi:hypothetical protein